MAEQNLRMAAELAARHPDQARALGVDEEEIAAWRDAATDMHVPFDRAAAASTRRTRTSPTTS